MPGTQKGTTMSLDWEGLRTFAHVCKAGNMSAAARELGVNQTTVARRLARLEEWLGYAILHRDGGVLRATASARPLLETAQSMQTTVADLLDQSAPDISGDQVSGAVRITGVDAILEQCVAPHLASLHAKHPRISLELMGANRNLSLPQRETDLALRLARPESGAFHIRRLGYLEYGVYYHPMDRGIDALDSTFDPTTLPWIDLDEFFADKPEQRWLNDTFPDRTVIGTGNRSSLMVSMMRNVACCALLPVCLGDAFDWLHKLPGCDPVGREVWLLTHQDKRHLPQVRAVADWLRGILVDGVAISKRTS